MFALTLNAKLDTLVFRTTQPKRIAYLKSLLTPGIRRELAQSDYFDELFARYAAVDKSDAAIGAKERFRKARARDKFKGLSTPLPVLEPR